MKSRLALRVALTGATGFIGRAVLRQLRTAGASVRALAHSADLVPADEMVDWRVGDVCSPDLWPAFLTDMDVVIHLASAGVADLNALDDNLRTNLPAFARMMRFAKECQVRRVVVAGSCFEYGRSGEQSNDCRLRETDPLTPTNFYAATKAATTILAGPLSAQFELDTIILRPFHVYGPGEPPQRLVQDVLTMARSGRRIETTDGRQVRDLVHLDDVADAFVTAATVDRPRTRPEYLAIYNVGSGIATPMADVIREIARLCRAEDRLAVGARPHRPAEMWRLVADPTKAATELGWQSRVAWRDGLRQLIEA